MQNPLKRQEGTASVWRKIGLISSKTVLDIFFTIRTVNLWNSRLVTVGIVEGFKKGSCFMGFIFL